MGFGISIPPQDRAANTQSRSISIPPSYEETRDMSITGIKTCTDGVILLSDSRRTAPDGTYHDDERKIFPVPGTTLALTLTGTCRFKQESESIWPLLRSLSGQHLDTVSSAIVQYLNTNVPLEQDCYVSIVDVTNHTARTNIARNGPLHDFIITPGKLLFSETTFSGEPWATSLLRYWDAAPMSVRDSIPVVQATFEHIIGLAQYMAPKFRTIGGPVQMLAINCTGDEIFNSLLPLPKK